MEMNCSIVLNCTDTNKSQSGSPIPRDAEREITQHRAAATVLDRVVIPTIVGEGSNVYDVPACAMAAALAQAVEYGLVDACHQFFVLSICPSCGGKVKLSTAHDVLLSAKPVAA